MYIFIYIPSPTTTADTQSDSAQHRLRGCRPENQFFLLKATECTMASHGKKPTDKSGWTILEKRGAGRFNKPQPIPAGGCAVAGPSSGGAVDAGPSPAGGSAKHDPHVKLEWPMVQCHTCPIKAKWRHMMSIKTVDVAENFKDTDEPEIDYFIHECHLCVAKRLGITEDEARTRIREGRADSTKRKRRAEKYKKASELSADIPMNTSRKERRLFTRDLLRADRLQSSSPENFY